MKYRPTQSVGRGQHSVSILSHCMVQIQRQSNF